MSTHDQSLKALWQNLPSETVTFTTAQMQSRAAKFQAKHKRRDIIEYSGYVVLFGLVAYMLTVQATWKDWVASGLAVIGGIVAMWNYYRLAGVKAMPSSNSANTLLDFMRRELMRQRDAASSAWRWYVLPLMPFCIFVMAYRWIEEGSTLTEITDMRLFLLLMTGFMAAFFGACILWYFLRAARYQRQLDGFERYVSE